MPLCTYGEAIGSFIVEQFTYNTIANLKMIFKDFKGKVAGVSHGVYPYVVLHMPVPSHVHRLADFATPLTSLRSF